MDVGLFRTFALPNKSQDRLHILHIHHRFVYIDVGLFQTCFIRVGDRFEAQYRTAPQICTHVCRNLEPCCIRGRLWECHSGAGSHSGEVSSGGGLIGGGLIRGRSHPGRSHSGQVSSGGYTRAGDRFRSAVFHSTSDLYYLFFEVWNDAVFVDENGKVIRVGD